MATEKSWLPLRGSADSEEWLKIVISEYTNNEMKLNNFIVKAFGDTPLHSCSSNSTFPNFKQSLLYLINFSPNLIG